MDENQDPQLKSTRLLQPTFKAASTEEELCVLIAAVRKNAGLSQTELAKKMGTSQRVISRIETGESPPTYKTLKKISEATNTRLEVSFLSLG